MSERVNGRDSNIHFQKKAYLAERPGILTAPSEDLIKRRQQSQQARVAMLEMIREAELQKAALREAEQEVVAEEPTLTLVEELEKLQQENLVLPIEAHREEIVETIENNKATIIISETGSGKSTQVPQYLVEAGYDHVFVIQGRRGMADGLSDRIQSEFDARLGNEAADGLVDVIHGGRTVTHENSKMTVLTAATLIHMMPEIAKKYGDKKVGIFADEIHEDDQYVELATGVSGIEVSKHDDWRLIGMSATIDPEPIKVPFGRVTNADHPELVDVPVVRVEGRLFPLEIREAPKLTPAETFLAYGQEHRRVMLGERGFEQIRRMKEQIIEAYEAQEAGSSSRLVFREFTSKTSTFQRAELARISTELPDELQLIVLATPAARSGITIPGITFVSIGSLINREKRHEDRSRGIIPEYMSQAEVHQFLSRGGRDTAGGIGYLSKPTSILRKRRGTKSTANGQNKSQKKKPEDEFAKAYPYVALSELDDYPEPAIFNSNLSELILIGSNAGYDPDVLNRHIMNEQNQSVLDGAVRRLRDEFSALDQDKKITEIGRLMSRFPVAPELSRGLAEAMRNGRSKQHLARMAMIATAIDAGGIQSLKKAENAEWAGLVRPESSDDFMAQLDFILAMRQEGFKGGPSHDGAVFAYLHDLEYSRILGTEEPTEKIMRRMGIDTTSFEVEAPNAKEISEIRDDFTAGMYGLTYRHFQRKDDPLHYFRPIQHSNVFPERSQAKQSVLKPTGDELIAGMPQFYMSFEKGNLKQVDVLGATLRVTPESVGRHALAGNLVQYVEVPGTSHMDGGMVVQSEQGMFGSLKVGSHRVSKERKISPERQKRLIETVQNKPGYELQGLRDLAKDLANLRRLMPTNLLNEYRRPQAPKDITHTIIEQQLKKYATTTPYTQEIDALVGKFAEGQTIDLYYQSNAREEIHRRSPESLIIAGEPLTIYYRSGMPYVTKVSANQLAVLTEPLYIDEGFEERREVMRQVKKDGGRGTKLVSFGTTES